MASTTASPATSRRSGTRDATYGAAPRRTLQRLEIGPARTVCSAERSGHQPNRRGLLIFAVDVGWGLVVGVRVEEDVVAAQFGNSGHPIRMPHRPFHTDAAPGRWLPFGWAYGDSGPGWAGGWLSRSR